MYLSHLKQRAFLPLNPIAPISEKIFFLFKCVDIFFNSSITLELCVCVLQRYIIFNPFSFAKGMIELKTVMVYLGHEFA